VRRTSLLLPILLVAATPIPAALAHGVLVESFPQRKVHLTNSPHQIRLRFSIRADANYSTLSLEAEDGSVIASKTQETASQDFHMPAPELGPGRYRLSYRVLSPDGDLLNGKIDFEIDR
jgi:copper resistance protein C